MVTPLSRLASDLDELSLEELLCHLRTAGSRSETPHDEALPPVLVRIALTTARSATDREEAS